MVAKQGKRAILQKNVFKGGIAYFIEKNQSKIYFG